MKTCPVCDAVIPDDVKPVQDHFDKEECWLKWFEGNADYREKIMIKVRKMREKRCEV